MLDHTPICPYCSDVLVPSNISTILGVAFCQACATRAKVCHWPEPYDFSHVFDPRDLMYACGIHWYHPIDGSQEPAVARLERRAAQEEDAEQFRRARLN